MTAVAPPITDHAPDLVTRVREGGLSGSKNLLLGIGVLSLIVTIVMGFVEHWSMGFLSAYLTGWMYGLSLCLGALFFVMIQHLTRAGWSVTVRRVAEHMAANVWVFVPLAIPLLYNYQTLWGAWVEPDPNDAVVAGKSSYLDATFFFIRFAVYFAFWIFVARWFRACSLKQDETGDPQLSLKMSYRAAPCLLGFALTVTFGSIDWMMTLDPHWYSTIFGIVFFAGCFVSFLALSTLLFKGMGRAGYLKDCINTEHYHDLGKLLFAFVVFWTYTSFSQYFLIWFANIPEETAWFALRKKDGWETVFYILAFGHFLIPFAFLLGRHIKRNKFALGVGAAYMLVLHWVDLHFYIAPAAAHHAPGHGHGGNGGGAATGLEDAAAHGHATWAEHLSITDATTAVAMLCIVAGLTLNSTRSHNLIPVRDPGSRKPCTSTTFEPGPLRDPQHRCITATMSHSTPDHDDLPPEHDPLKDIDGPKVVASLAGTAVVLFLGLFLLWALFGESVGTAREDLINNAPTEERNKVLGYRNGDGQWVAGQEDKILSGKLMSGKDAKPIDQVLKDLAR